MPDTAAATKATTPRRTREEIAEARERKAMDALKASQFNRRKLRYIAEVAVLDDAIRTCADDLQVRRACEAFNAAMATLMAVRPEPNAATMTVTEH